MNNKILKDWFWPWQIFFDSNVKKRVLDFASNLKSEEKNFYDVLIKFYSQYYTLQMLIDYIAHNKNKALNAINYALENDDKILNIPEQMKDDFIITINKLSCKYKYQLLQLLEKAINSNNKVDYNKYYTNILGVKNFQLILQKIQRYDFKQTNCNFDTIASIDAIHNEFKNTISNKEFYNRWQGYIPNYQIVIKSGEGYEQYYLNKYYNFLNCALTNKTEKLDSCEKANVINYPLFKENYYMGAIILYDKIKDKKELKNFYKIISNENLTDFY